MSWLVSLERSEHIAAISALCSSNIKSCFDWVFFKAIPTIPSVSGKKKRKKKGNALLSSLWKEQLKFFLRFVRLHGGSSLCSSWDSEANCIMLRERSTRQLASGATLIFWLYYCYDWQRRADQSTVTEHPGLTWTDRQPLHRHQRMRQLPIMPLTLNYLFWNQYCPVLEPAAVVSGMFIIFTACLKALSVSAR